MENHQAQKQCKHCKEMVNKDAKRCPKCQWDLRSWFNRHPIWTVLIAIIVFSGVIGAFEDDAGSPQASTEVVSEKTEDQKMFEELKSQIPVSGYVKDEYGFAHAYLKITNNTKHPIDLFAFEAKLYNNADELQRNSMSFGNDQTFGGQSQELLAPGQTVNWKWQLVWFDNATKIGNIEITKLHLKDTGKTYQ